MTSCISKELYLVQQMIVKPCNGKGIRRGDQEVQEPLMVDLLCAQMRPSNQHTIIIEKGTGVRGKKLFRLKLHHCIVNITSFLIDE